MTHAQEGVIQYRYQLQALAPNWPADLLQELSTWRDKMLDAGWIGQQANRYGGLGFGNLSHRLPQPGQPDAFLITASQTSHLKPLTANGWTLVTSACLATNQVLACGHQPPSSESLSHAAIYQAQATANAVIHVHSPQLWQQAIARQLPATPAQTPYGTPAMAQAIQDQATSDRGLLVMLGHQDGVLAWGKDLADAANQLLQLQQTGLRMK